MLRHAVARCLRLPYNRALRAQQSRKQSLCFMRCRYAHNIRAKCAENVPDFSARGHYEADKETGRATPRVSFVCPACGQRLHRLTILQRHFQNCCPDLVPTQAWQNTNGDRQAIKHLVAVATEAELKFRRTCIDTAFRQVDQNGNQIKLSTEQVAEVLQLPVQRVKQAFRMAQKAMPLVGDPEPVEVIHEDDDIIAVNKPPHVISAPKHRYTGGSMVNRLITYLGYPPRPAHRLDMMTSGVLVMAKHRDSASCLGYQFGQRTAKKAYLAIVTGSPSQNEFSISVPIGRHPSEQIARAPLADGDSAHTDFTVLSSNPEADLGQYSPGLVASEHMYQTRGVALVIARPVTGRTHQIRVHLAAAGHAILGDEVYGLQGSWVGRQALHAASLSIQHPSTKETLQITASLPEDMASALKTLHVSCPTWHELQQALSVRIAAVDK